MALGAAHPSSGRESMQMESMDHGWACQEGLEGACSASSFTPSFAASTLHQPGAGELQARAGRCEHLTCLLVLPHWECFLGETACSPAGGFWKLFKIISTLPGKHMAQTYELNNHFSPQQQLIVAYLLRLVYIAY